jgi:hypothetical protein
MMPVPPRCPPSIKQTRIPKSTPRTAPEKPAGPLPMITRSKSLIRLFLKKFKKKKEKPHWNITILCGFCYRCMVFAILCGCIDKPENINGYCWFLNTKQPDPIFV